MQEKNKGLSEVQGSSFPLCFKLSHFNPPPLNDPHNKRPLIDYYPNTRGVNGLSLPVCPLFIYV